MVPNFKKISIESLKNLNDNINKLEPANDPDRDELPDGTTVSNPEPAEPASDEKDEAISDKDGESVTSIVPTSPTKMSLVQKFYASLRTAPLRKVLAFLTYVTDVTIVMIGLFLQKDLPNEVASGWNISRIIIYGGYFGTSSTEAVASILRKHDSPPPPPNE